MTDIARRFFGTDVMHVRLTQFSQYGSSELSEMLRYTRILGVFPDGSIHLSSADTGRMYGEAVYLRRLVCTPSVVFAELSHFPESDSHKRMIQAFLAQCGKLRDLLDSTRHILFEFFCAKDVHRTPAFVLSAPDHSLKRVVIQKSLDEEKYPMSVDVRESEADDVLEIQALLFDGTPLEFFPRVSSIWSDTTLRWSWRSRFDLQGLRVFDVRLIYGGESQRACLFSTDKGVFLENASTSGLIAETESVLFTHILVQTGSVRQKYACVAGDGSVWELCDVFSRNPSALRRECIFPDNTYAAPLHPVYSAAFGEDLQGAFRYGDARIPSGSYRVVPAEFTEAQ